MQPPPSRDHGGNLDAAVQAYGGTLEQWIDLSTGINPAPYPVPGVPASAWAALPRKPEQDALVKAAATAFSTAASITAFAGAQGAIQAIPHLQTPSQARVLTPTYNEHAAALRAAGWEVSQASTLAALQGAPLAVVVNPNNPDGKRYSPAELLALASTVDTLVVDESFVDPEPELSLAPYDARENIIILRSFGKFYGLAGIRVGFTLSSPKTAARLKDIAGPWPVAGPSLPIAARALADVAWQQATIARLTQDAARLDALALRKGWELIGGSPLFRTYATPSAQGAQEHLAKQHIWSRIFPYSNSWIRLGLTHGPDNWQRLEQVFAS